MKYLKKYNKFSQETKCRICLTHSLIGNTALDAPLKPADNDSPLVSEALEILTKESLVGGPNLPNSLCGMCVNLLQIAYDLIKQYHLSKHELNIQCQEEKKQGGAAVDIFVGNERFSVADLLIVEDDGEPFDYQGFLKNLGKSVSASIVNKDSSNTQKRLKEDPPNVVIEKLTTTSKGFIDDNEEIMNTALKLKYKCPHCSRPISSAARMKIHTQTCLKNYRNLSCYVCKLKFRNRHQVVKHLKQTHLNPSSCPQCGEFFTTKHSRRYHMMKHLGKRYGCVQCPKRFFTKFHLNLHSQTHSKQTTREMCPVCGKTFHYTGGLMYHMKSHTEGDLRCKYCPNRYHRRANLQRHETSHTGERPFACSFCEKKFCSSSDMRRHHKLHTGERQYRCKYCEMTFIESYNLKKHLMTHPGQFHCGHCQKTFADMDILKFHLKLKHHINEAEVVEVVEKDQTASEEVQLDTYFIAEQFEDLNYVTYELADDVLVETVSEF